MTDVIWKLNYPVCLYRVPVKVQGMKLNLPDFCPNQPLHGKPFCKEHTQHLQAAGIPDDLLGFLGHLKKLMKGNQTAILGKLISKILHFL